MTRVIACANQKGGVGKSTSTAHLARAAQRQGWRVLVYDADSQGNVSSALAAEPLDRDTDGVVVQPTVADVLVPQARFAIPIREVIVPTIYGDGVDLAPSATALAGVEQMLVPVNGRETVMRETLAPVLEDYDLVLFDCPPSLQLLTINALSAATAVLVIAQPQLWSTDGMSELRRTVSLVRDRWNPTLGYVGVLMSMWQGTTEERATLRNREALADIREYFAEAPLLQPFIPQRTGVGGAIEAGVPLDKWHGASERVIAEDYLIHAKTIMTNETKAPRHG